MNDVVAVIIVDEEIAILPVIERRKDRLHLVLCRFVISGGILIDVVDRGDSELREIEDLTLLRLEHVLFERIDAAGRQLCRLPGNECRNRQNGKDQRNNRQRNNLMS
jgi:hypothetical protein